MVFRLPGLVQVYGELYAREVITPPRAGSTPLHKEKPPTLPLEALLAVNKVG